MRIAAPYVVLMTPDYNLGAGYEWPDRSGQLVRAPRKKAAPGA